MTRTDRWTRSPLQRTGGEDIKILTTLSLIKKKRHIPGLGAVSLKWKKGRELALHEKGMYGLYLLPNPIMTDIKV